MSLSGRITSRDGSETQQRPLRCRQDTNMYETRLLICYCVANLRLGKPIFNEPLLYHQSNRSPHSPSRRDNLVSTEVLPSDNHTLRCGCCISRVVFVISVASRPGWRMDGWMDVVWKGGAQPGLSVGRHHLDHHYHRHLEGRGH